MVLCSSCEYTTPKSTAISILADRTDTYITFPKTNDVLNLLDIDASPNDGVDLKFQNLGHVDFNPTYSVSLKPSSFLDNDYERKSEIKRFLKAVDTLITKENRKLYNFRNSSIIVPLLDKLSELSNTNADPKHVLLYSDLFEYSDIYNVYDYKSELQLQKHTSSVAKLFSSRLNISDLSGITLHIVYYPKTKSQNRLFQKMVRVYRELFEDSGLTIKIGIDNRVL